MYRGWLVIVNASMVNHLLVFSAKVQIKYPMMMRQQSTSNPRIGRDPVSFLSMGNYPAHVIESAISKAVVRRMLDLFRHLASSVVIMVVNKGPSGTSRHLQIRSSFCYIRIFFGFFNVESLFDREWFEVPTRGIFKHSMVINS
ncbi:hypothetical protein BKA93DRAFT_748055 [Sparassis latifolia]